MSIILIQWLQELRTSAEMKHTPHDTDCKKRLKKFMEHLITSELHKIKMSNITSQHNVVILGFFHISSLLFLYCDCIGSGDKKGVILHDHIFGFWYNSQHRFHHLTIYYWYWGWSWYNWLNRFYWWLYSIIPAWMLSQ